MSFRPGQSKPQICYNGDFLIEQSFIHDAYFHHMKEQAYIVEHVRGYASNLFWFHEHFEQLTFKLTLLGYHHPKDFSIDKIRKEINQLIHKGKYFKGIIVALIMLPSKEKTDYLIQITPCEQKEFSLNEKGLRINIYTKNYKRIHKFSPFYESDLYLRQLARLFCIENKLDNCLLINPNKNIIESLSGNFFMLFGDQIVTPPLTDGAMHTPIRSAIIETIQENNMPFEEKIITIKDMEESTELFLCDTFSGIQWVVALNLKRYFNKKIKKITEKLREHALSQKPITYKPE